MSPAARLRTPWRRAISSSACSRAASPGRRRWVRAQWARSPKRSESWPSARASAASASPGTSAATSPSACASTSSQWRKHCPFSPFLRLGAALAEGEQAGEARPAGAILGPDQQGRPVHQVEPAAGDEPDAGDIGGAQGMDQPADRVAVGDAERGIAEQGRGREQLLRAGDAAQEAEMAGDLELDVGHPNTPCRYQLRSPLRSFSPSPRRNSQKRWPASSSTWK